MWNISFENGELLDIDKGGMLTYCKSFMQDIVCLGIAPGFPIKSLQVMLLLKWLLQRSQACLSRKQLPAVTFEQVECASSVRGIFRLLWEVLQDGKFRLVFLPAAPKIYII